MCKQVQSITILTLSSLAWPGQCYSAEACISLYQVGWAIRLGKQLWVWGLPSRGMQGRLIGKEPLGVKLGSQAQHWENQLFAWGGKAS